MAEIDFRGNVTHVIFFIYQYADATSIVSFYSGFFTLSCITFGIFYKFCRMDYANLNFVEHFISMNNMKYAYSFSSLYLYGRRVTVFFINCVCFIISGLFIDCIKL